MFYIQSVSPDGKTMQNVMIWEPGRTIAVRAGLSAKSARIEGTDIILDRAVQTRINGDGQISAVDVIANEVRLPLPMGDNGQNFLSNSYNDTYTMNTARLSQDIKFRKPTGKAAPISPCARSAGHEVRVPVRRVHRGGARRAAGGQVRQERTHARHRALDRRPLRLLRDGRARGGVRQERRAQPVPRRVAPEHHHGRGRRPC